MSSSAPISGKSIAVIAHLTFIGFVIAIVLNNRNKTQLGSFYLGQMLGIILTGLLAFMPGIVGVIFALLALLFWLTSIVGALLGKMYQLPIAGTLFQDWFN